MREVVFSPESVPTLTIVVFDQEQPNNFETSTPDYTGIEVNTD